MKDVFFFTRLSEKTKETIKIVKNKQKLYGDPCWIESLSGNCRCGGGASVLYVMSEAVLQVHERRFIFLREGCSRDVVRI